MVEENDMAKPRRIIAAIIAILIAWYLIESETREACAGDQACIAASL